MRVTTSAVTRSVVVLSCLALRSAAAWPAGEWLPNGAREVLTIAATNNPRIDAAACQQQAEADQALAFDGFYRPRLGVLAGGGRGPNAAPESTLTPWVDNNKIGVEAGLLLPLRAGAYLGVGAAQRYLFDVDGFDDLGQTTAGVRLEIPLWQDRGFRSHVAEQEALDATAAAAAAAAREAAQAVGHEALLRYATWLYAAAETRESREALRRVERLLEETSGRIELQTMAEYQVFAARMEVSFREEELLQSKATLLQSQQALLTTLGGALNDGDLPKADPALLYSWAQQCATVAVERVAAMAQERPELLQARYLVAAAERRKVAASEGLRSQVSLQAGIGYQGEDSSGGLGRDKLLDQNRAGVEVALAWSRPLSFDAEEAALRAAHRREAALMAALRQIELGVSEQVAQAEAAVKAAHDRLGLVEHGVNNARQALTAEEERLALGEGSNRSVLDAQKDLTTAERRANVAAFDMIVAFNDLMYARGIPLLPVEVEDVIVNQAP